MSKGAGGADVFRGTMRGTAGRTRTSADLLEAARQAVKEELSATMMKKKRDRRTKSKKRKPAGPATDADQKGVQSPAKGTRDDAERDGDADYDDDSFDQEDAYEDDFEPVTVAVTGASPVRPHEPLTRDMVAVDVSADMGFESTLHGTRKKRGENAKKGRKSSTDVFNDNSTSRAGLPGRRDPLTMTDDEVSQRTNTGGGRNGVRSSTEDGLPPLQPSRGGTTGRGAAGMSPVTPLSAGYTSDALVASPLPTIGRRAR